MVDYGIMHVSESVGIILFVETHVHSTEQQTQVAGVEGEMMTT